MTTTAVRHLAPKARTTTPVPPGGGSTPGTTAVSLPVPLPVPPPLLATAAAMDDAVSWLDVLVGDPALTLGAHGPAGDPVRGWHRLEDVVATAGEEDGVLSQWRRALAERQASLRGTAIDAVPRQVPAMLQLLWLLDMPALVGGLAFGLHRRVPDVRPQALAFRLQPDDLFPEAVALRGTGFACLPDDPAATGPGARVVADEEALAEELRTQVAATAAALLSGWEPGVRLGRRQRWAAVTDAVDAALQVSGRARGDGSLGQADGALVLGGRDDSARAPFVATTSQYPVRDDQGRTYWARRRVSCCYFYTLPGSAACFSCPRTSDAERAARMSSWDALPSAD